MGSGVGIPGLWEGVEPTGFKTHSSKLPVPQEIMASAVLQ